MSPSHVVRATLVGGLLAAVLDLGGAIALQLARGGEAIKTVQAIASGFLGREAYAGGAATAALGAALHLGIATSMAAAYMLAATRLRWLTQRPWLWGPLYGLAMWGLMYNVVLPLRWPQHFPRHELRELLGQLACHVFLVGLPIAFVASRVLRARDDAR